MERPLKHPGAKSVGWALVQAARLHRSRMGDKLVELGLFAGQEQVLQALAAAGLMTMGELATVLRVRPPTASKTVSRLAALRLVERHAEPDDARIVRVKLTEEGQRKAAAIEQVWDDVEAELLDGFDAKDRKRLRKLLRRVAKNLAEAAGADSRGLETAGRGHRRGLPEPRPATQPRSSVSVRPARAIAATLFDYPGMEAEQQQRGEEAEREHVETQTEAGSGRGRCSTAHRHRADLGEQHVQAEGHREGRDDAHDGGGDRRERAGEARGCRPGGRDRARRRRSTRRTAGR